MGLQPRSDPVRCHQCGGNSWHLFEGDADPSRGGEVVYLRLRCTNPHCRRVLVGRWLKAPVKAIA